MRRAFVDDDEPVGNGDLGIDDQPGELLETREVADHVEGSGVELVAAPNRPFRAYRVVVTRRPQTSPGRLNLAGQRIEADPAHN